MFFTYHIVMEHSIAYLDLAVRSFYAEDIRVILKVKTALIITILPFLFFCISLHSWLLYRTKNFESGKAYKSTWGDGGDNSPSDVVAKQPGRVTNGQPQQPATGAASGGYIKRYASSSWFFFTPFLNECLTQEDGCCYTWTLTHQWEIMFIPFEKCILKSAFWQNVDCIIDFHWLINFSLCFSVLSKLPK